MDVRGGLYLVAPAMILVVPVQYPNRKWARGVGHHIPVSLMPQRRPMFSETRCSELTNGERDCAAQEQDARPIVGELRRERDRRLGLAQGDVGRRDPAWI